MAKKTQPNSFRLFRTQKYLSTWYSSKLTYPHLIEEDYYLRKLLMDLFEGYAIIIDKILISRLDLYIENTTDIHVEVFCYKRGKFYVIKHLFALTCWEIRARIEQKRKLKALRFQLAEVASSELLEISKFRKMTKIKTILNNLKYHDTLFTLYTAENLKDLMYQTKIKKLERQIQKQILLTQKYVIVFFQLLIRHLENLIKFYYCKKAVILLRFQPDQFHHAMLIAKYIGRYIEPMPYRKLLNRVGKRCSKTQFEGVKIEVAGRLNGIEMARTERRFKGKLCLSTMRKSVTYACWEQPTKLGIFGIKVWLTKKDQPKRDMQDEKKDEKPNKKFANLSTAKIHKTKLVKYAPKIRKKTSTTKKNTSRSFNRHFVAKK
jgi:ribosomal protein S3